MDVLRPRLSVASALWPEMAALGPLAEEAALLEPPSPHERAGIHRDEAGLLVDGLLARVARGRGALDVALGEGLAALAEGDRALRLGYSGIGDYARERLGIAGRTAQGMARLARELRSRPALRAAVRSGEVSSRKAQAVLPVARGEAEAGWVARARVETVRALEAAVREAGAAEEPEEDWERIAIGLSPSGRERLDEAMGLAGKLLGATAPRWQRLEAICQEYLGAHPGPEPGDGEERAASGWDEGRDLPEEAFLRGPVADWLTAAKAALEEERDRWAALQRVEPVAAPYGCDALGSDDGPLADEGRPGNARTEDGGPAGAGTSAALGRTDPGRLDAELRRLTSMRDRWDEVLGHLALLLRMLGLWRDLGFASFSHYCAERLGLSARAVEQRVALERRLHALPSLREAMREGRISYEKARLVASCADEGSAPAWIDRAAKTTCAALREEVEALEAGAQMCARPELSLRVPRRVGRLLDAALRAAREAAGEWLGAGECLERVAAHFVETWKGALSGKPTRHQRVLERDGGRCQVPGCSRAAVHAHHVLYRSRGGEDDPSNLVSLCAAHHLHGVHRGFLRVKGRAPDRLRWGLGESSRAL